MEGLQKDIDVKAMQRALKLASLAGVNAAPNPMVGAVILHNQKIIGEGAHQMYGGPHAEVNAINSVENKDLLTEATIYVTLEPCAHQGKTPPCADLIVKHRFKRVVVACLDTNAKVAGKGIQRIKEAGIAVTIGVLEEEARQLNKRFFTFMEKQRPYVFLKWAETRDGFVDRLPEEREAGINWITTPRMRLFVHKWRSQEQAIMVGWKTINNDDPQLNVRNIAGPSPLRFIIDPHGKVNPKASCFQDGAPIYVLTSSKTLDLPAHVQLILLPEINATTILQALYQLKIISVFIEGGAYTLQTFIHDGLWDEAYQLIGKTEFKTGVKAPHLISKIVIEQKKVEGDFLNWYRKR